MYFVVLHKQIQESRDPRSPQLKVRTELTAWCVTGSLFTRFIPTRDDLDGFTQWLFVGCGNPFLCGDAEQSWTPEGEFTPGLEPWVSFPQDNPGQADGSFKQTSSLCSTTVLVARGMLVTWNIFFPRKTLIRAHRLGINSYQDIWSKARIGINRKSLTQGWFLRKQAEHSNPQEHFEIKSAIIWARAGSKKVFQTFHNGFSMILQGVHCPMSTIMHSNKENSSKPECIVLLFQHFVSVKSWQGTEASASQQTLAVMGYFHLAPLPVAPAGALFSRTAIHKKWQRHNTYFPWALHFWHLRLKMVPRCSQNTPKSCRIVAALFTRHSFLIPVILIVINAPCFSLECFKMLGVVGAYVLPAQLLQNTAAYL